MSSNLAHKIFVYGTLMRGQPNYFRMQDSEKYGTSRFIGEAKLKGVYPMVIASTANVPMLLDKEGEGKEVFGEVYEIDDRLLEHLDWLESHPDVYTRTPIQCVLLETQTVLDCEVYMVFNFNPDLLSLPYLSKYSNDKDKQYKSREERGGDSYASEVKK